VTSGPRRAVAGAAAAGITQRLLLTNPPGPPASWLRSNHRGQQLSLVSGPALAVAMTAVAALPRSVAVVSSAGVAAIGRYDDTVGRVDGAKGFRGHLGALRSGRLTAGSVKVLGIGAAGLLTAIRLGPRRPGDVLLGGSVVAGCANLVNLLDLRPGRALKVGTAAALALGDLGVAGSCAALLPADLGERTMLGDAGANALGAVLGSRLAAVLPGRRARLAALALLAGLSMASEWVSFTAVIEGSPPLRWLDQLGRRP
jgi:UDP-GlcNAc:undecaprenyl-phosphate GlcNAc-1-phosphate transferase